MMCYRRLLFSKSIQALSNDFKDEIISHSKKWINHTLSFRRRVSHPVKDFNIMYQNLEPTAIAEISEWKWEFFPTLCIHHPTVAKSIIALLYPLVHIVKLFFTAFKK